jgi:hypothetical protein
MQAEQRYPPMFLLADAVRRHARGMLMLNSHSTMLDEGKGEATVADALRCYPVKLVFIRQ